MSSPLSDEFEIPDESTPSDSTWHATNPSAPNKAGAASSERPIPSRKLPAAPEATPAIHSIKRMNENNSLGVGNNGPRRGLPYSVTAGSTRRELPYPGVTIGGKAGNDMIPLPETGLTTRPILPLEKAPPAVIPAKELALPLSLVFDDVNFLEHFHLIFRQLGINPSLEAPVIIGITSSVRGEGRTLMALGLAQAIALQIPQPVLFIEADLQQPTLALDLELDNRGLCEYLREELSLEDVVQSTEIADLSIILAGEAQGDPLKVLRSARLASLLNSLKHYYAAIIVDMPPLNMTAESTRLMTFTDKILFVVEANTTPARLAKAALSIVPLDKRAGVVLNRTQVPLRPLKRLKRLILGPNA